MSGLATKILALTDALGNLVHFRLMAGQHYDTVGVPELIKGITFKGFIADKAFDIQSIINEMTKRRVQIVIPQRKNRIEKREFDIHVYRSRHLIENFFAKLKEFKKIAMRGEKTDRSFTALIYLAAAFINSR